MLFRSIKERQEQPNEVENRLVMDEESQGLLFDTSPIFDECFDDEDDINTLTDESEIKIESVENSSNFMKTLLVIFLSFRVILQMICPWRLELIFYYK